MPLLDKVRRRLADTVHSFRPFRGNLDGFRDGCLVGWVVPRDPAAAPVKVGVFTPRGLIAQGTANIFRPDLAASGISDGHNGFAIPVDAIMLRTIRESGGAVRIGTLMPPSFTLARHSFKPRDMSGPATAAPHEPGPGKDGLEGLLYGALQQFEGLAAAEAEAPALPGRGALLRHGALFDRRDRLQGGELPPLMSGYSEYLYYRDKLHDRFDPFRDPADAGHMLRWMLAHYSTLRGGLRVPLTAAQIAWLNEPLMIPGQRFGLTRAHWSFFSEVRPILAAMDFSSDEWVAWAVQWWAIDRAEALHVEDCLVPPSYVEILAAIPAPWRGTAYAPSEFALRMHRQAPALSAMDLTQTEGRRRLMLSLMLMAVQRPDYLRYLDAGAIEALLAPAGGGPSAFAEFLDEMGAEGPEASRADYAAVLRRRGFDLDSQSFATLLPDGNRVHAAALPPVPPEPMVDLQLIGPFEKASGLGQATRLSASVVAAMAAEGDVAPITTRCVNFGLDNPAPEGFSRVGETHAPGRARINLIHLNAESIPLAFAYQPDMFSGAYNIGYFFWELDTPAACHYLGMEMLDEIWVSTEYGTSIYRPHADCPVTNVGMCYEDLPEIDPARARAFVQKTFALPRDAFVFLVVFDSFSFVQRKNPIGSIRAFLKAFPKDKDVRLVLKTQNRRRVADPAQIAIWEEVDKLIASDPRILLMNETLTYDDLLLLKRGCDVYVSLHRSEGWGFGMIEAMNLGVPVVCTGYSGNMDFCSDETAWLVAHDDVELGPNDYIFVVPGQKWAEPDVEDAARVMQAVRQDAEGRAARALAAQENVRRNFSSEAIARRYRARIDEILAGLPQDSRDDRRGGDGG